MGAHSTISAILWALIVVTDAQNNTLSHPKISVNKA